MGLIMAETLKTKQELKRYEELNRVGVITQKIADLVERTAEELKLLMGKKP